MLRSASLSAVVGTVALGLVVVAPSVAQAQYGYYSPGYYSFYAPGYSNTFVPGYYTFGSPYVTHYHGNAGHDVYPHWHNTYTPYGAFSWYGTGRHDFLPHAHTVTPWSYTGHHYTPSGYTQSIYPRYPNFLAGW